MLLDAAAIPMTSMTADLGWVLLKMLLLLGLMGACAFGLLWWGRRRGLGRYGQAPLVTILGRQALDAKHTTWLVQVRRRTLLLGGGNGQLSCLADLTHDDAGETP